MLNNESNYSTSNESNQLTPEILPEMFVQNNRPNTLAFQFKRLDEKPCLAPWYKCLVGTV